MRVETALMIVTLLDIALSLPLTTENKRANVTRQSHDLKALPSNQATISADAKDLLVEQTENIRQIIAAEKRSHEQRGKELNLSNSGKKQETALVDVGEERYISVEEFRNKCQHFSRLFGTNKPNENTERHSSTAAPIKSEYNSEKSSVVEVTRRPVYIRNKPTFIQKTNGGFYITTSSRDDVSTTKRPYWVSSTQAPISSTVYISSTGPPISSTTHIIKQANEEGVINIDKDNISPSSQIKIRYTKFEPVILQKTILSDGRVLYHWHKSLPTSAIGLPGKNAVQEPSTTPEPITTTTTEKSSWLFVPFSSFFGGSHEEETTTESTSVSPTSTSPQTAPSTTSGPVKSNTNNLSNDDIKLQHQLKFVIPVHYDDIDASQSKPSEYERYPYISKRPTSTATVQPSLQVIRSLAVPQRYGLAYTAPGYGLTINNGLYSRYSSNYGQGYQNIALEKQSRGIDNVSVQE